MLQVLLLSFSLFLVSVQADMYLQSVRGSNNRLDEANRERNNGNRLFDSQNNDRGGYNVGKLNYYVTEKVPISWTNQHGCGTEDVKHCEVILQALCDPMARDGTTTQRIPENPANCRNFNCDTDVKFGRHESYDYYQTCKQTQRNKGLFQASQNPNRDDATRTRQNPGGTRRGYECPEERDYYPYWNPSPWIDLAIWTKDTQKCAALQAESQNVKSKWFCDVPSEVADANNFGNGIGKTPITEEDCNGLNTATTQVGGNTTTLTATWTEVQPNGFPAPECLESRPTRPNHLGLVGGQTQWTYEWTVPEAFLADGETEKACTFRVRYNISEDYDASAKASDIKDDGTVAIEALTTGGFQTEGAANPENKVYDNLANVVDSRHNRKEGGGGNANNRPSTLQLWKKYGMTDAEVGYDAAENEIDNHNDGTNGNGLGAKRDYTLRNNPKPDILGQTFGNDDYRLRLQLAVNTAQYGRTFQDRTHMTYVMQRPKDAGNAEIKLITVAGKRGNIVQTFPGTEYFFVPEVAHVRQFDYVHFMWSGSNTNPNNNDGQGKQGTDRSNVCPMNGAIYDPDTENSRAGGEGLNTGKNMIGSIGTSYPAYVKEPVGYARANVYENQVRTTTAEDGTTIEKPKCGKQEQVQPPIAGFTLDAAEALCTGRRDPGAVNDFGNMEELDDAGASFSLAPQQATEIGCWNYVSTRNNNFSNRSQKGTLCVDEGAYASGDVGPNGDNVVTNVGWISVPPNTVSNIQTFSMQSEPKKGAASEEVWIEPVEMDLTEESDQIEIAIAFEQRALYSPKLVHRKSTSDDYSEVTDAKYETQTDANGNDQTVAMALVNEGGAYVVEDEVNVGAVVAIVFAGLVFIGAIMFIVWWKFFKAPPAADEYSVNYSGTGTNA